MKKPDPVAQVRRCPSREACRLLTIVLALASACRSPTAEQPCRGQQRRPSGELDVPALGTGKLATAPDPLAPMHGRVTTVAVRGGLLFAGSAAGVSAWDVEDPRRIRPLARIALPGGVLGLSLLGDPPTHLMLANGPSGVALVDVGAVRSGTMALVGGLPWSPAARGECHSPWILRPSRVQDGRAYAACGTGGVAELELADPAHLRVRRSLAVGGYVRDLVVLDAGIRLCPDASFCELVAAAAGTAGVHLLSFGTESMGVVSSRDTPGTARAIDARGSRLYVADGGHGMQVLEIGPKKDLRTRWQLSLPGTDIARSIAVKEGLACVSLGSAGMALLELPEAGPPRLTAHVGADQAITRARVAGTLLFAANETDGVLIFDLKVPAQPQRLYPALPPG